MTITIRILFALSAVLCLAGDAKAAPGAVWGSSISEEPEKCRIRLQDRFSIIVGAVRDALNRTSAQSPSDRLFIDSDLLRAEIEATFFSFFRAFIANPNRHYQWFSQSQPPALGIIIFNYPVENDQPLISVTALMPVPGPPHNVARVLGSSWHCSTDSFVFLDALVTAVFAYIVIERADWEHVSEGVRSKLLQLADDNIAYLRRMQWQRFRKPELEAALTRMKSRLNSLGAKPTSIP